MSINEALARRAAARQALRDAEKEIAAEARKAATQLRRNRSRLDRLVARGVRALFADHTTPAEVRAAIIAATRGKLGTGKTAQKDRETLEAFEANPSEFLVFGDALPDESEKEERAARVAARNRAARNTRKPKAVSAAA